MESSIAGLKGCSENLSWSAWYLRIFTPNVTAHILKDTFPVKCSYWFLLLIRCIYFKLLNWSNMTWASQMRALVSLPENCGTNPVWSNQSWFTETTAPGLLPVSLHMDPDLFHFFIQCRLLDVPNTHAAQRGTSSFRSIHSFVRTPSFSSLNMDLV